MISCLKLKLAEAEEDTSCVALNRLRTKLRELMKDSQRTDQQVPVVVERSIETLVDLSKSCEDLRMENERLREELTQIRHSLMDLVVPVIEDSVIPLPIDEEETDMSALLSRLRSCEALLAELRTQLDEKAARVVALQSELEEQKRSADLLALDLDRMIVSREAMMDEVTASKRELEGRDDKACHFISSRLYHTRSYSIAHMIS